MEVVDVVVWRKRRPVGADDGPQFVTWVGRIHLNGTLPP
jgi:hypothetical protein